MPVLQQLPLAAQQPSTSYTSAKLPSIIFAARSSNVGLFSPFFQPTACVHGNENDIPVATFLVLYSCSMVWFEWDDAKARTNERKHGVRFEDAMLVFADPFALVEQDRIEGGELRWQTLGLVGGVALLLVAHTVRSGPGEEAIRIISARKATRKERQRYDQNRAKETLD